MKFSKLLTGNILVQLIAVLFSVIINYYIGHGLGQDAIAQYSLFKRISNYIYPVISLGTVIYFSKYVHSSSKNLNSIFSIFNFFTCIIFPFFYIKLFSFNLSFIGVDNDQLFYYYFIAFVVFQITQVLLRAHFKINILSFLTILINLTLVLVLLMSKTFHEFVTTSSLWQILFSIAGSLLFVNAIQARVDLKAAFKEVLVMVRYGIHRVPQHFLLIFVNIGTIYIVENYDGTKTNDYVLTTNYMSLIVTLTAPLVSILLPVMSKESDFYNVLKSKLSLSRILVLSVAVFLVSVLYTVTVFPISDEFVYSFNFWIILSSSIFAFYFQLLRNFIEFKYNKPVLTYIMLFSFLVASVVLMLLMACSTPVFAVSVFIFSFYFIANICLFRFL